MGNYSPTADFQTTL